MKNKFLIVFIFILNNLTAQKESNYWVFDEFNILNFKDSLKSYNNGKIGLSECSSSICDTSGNVLFYTDGLNLWNRYNMLVKNSENIGFPFFGTNTSRQGILLLRTNKDYIYLFNTDYQARSEGLNYSIIDIHGNNDSGEVILKKKKIVGYTNEAITAINHDNGKDIWIIAHSALSNKFYSILLKENGLVSCINEQIIGPNNYSGILDGQTNMKISPNGKYIARTVGNYSFLELYEFNNIYGSYKYMKKLINYEIITGVEFSPNSKFLYYSKRDSAICQYEIKTDKNFNLKYLNSFPSQLQLATDGNIYLTIPYNKYLAGIFNPNNKYSSYKDSLIFLNSNIVRTNLPNFNQSYFYTPAINFSYEMECINNSIQFWGYDTIKANVHNWQVRKLAVGNWQSVGSTKNINYTFADTGVYEIRYIATSASSVSDTVIKSITLYPKNKKNFLGNDTTYAVGSTINKTLFAPQPSHCVQWQDSSSLSTYTATKKGRYTCKVTNKAFCEVWDTIEIKECLSLQQPSIYHSNKGDTLFCSHSIADTFIWYKNNVAYKTTYNIGNKTSFIKLTDTGIYRVEAAKYKHCNRTSANFGINRLVLNALTLQNFNIKVFPNPSEGTVFITSENNYKLLVTDVAGRIIQMLNQVQHEGAFQHNGLCNKNVILPKGVYFFRFEVEGYFVTEKVVVL